MKVMLADGVVVVLLTAGPAACTDAPPNDPFDTSPTGGVESLGPGSNTDGPTGGSGGSGSASASGSGVDDTSGDDGIKLDVAPGDAPGPCVGDNCSDGCSAVDVVFVIDNSGSMGDYQTALGLAFPGFASTLDTALPPGTSLHVGVTSTEMGYSSSGQTTISNGNCTFIGDNDQPNDAFYVTPDVTDTGRNGAQGRLYSPPGGGQTYFEYVTGSGGAELAALEAWFSDAAAVGTNGSNIEMSTAPAGWIADPANDATNAGFIRDEGAVMVVFFMQDEPDQTPLVIDGQPGGQAMLDKLVAAKAGCGGLDCIIAGGFLNENACSAQGNLPLDDFLAGVGETPVVEPLPDEDEDPQAAADQMNMALSTTLADIIAETCEQIPPAG